MSAITESQAGDEIIIIEEFHASPHKEPFSWKTSRAFQVGEPVKFAGFYQDQRFTDHSGLGWTIIFDASDGKRYAATQTYFVTSESWERLRKYFSKGLNPKPRRRKASHK